MWSKRDSIIFFAGWMACNALEVHLMLQFSHWLPLKFWGITITNSLNIFGLISAIAISAALIWWASRAK